MPVNFPDVYLRKPAAPLQLVAGNTIIALYNQEHPDNKQDTLNKTVKKWMRKSAKERGWAKVKFVEQQCLLKVRFAKDND